MKLVTSYEHPPIPWRKFDWVAYDEDQMSGVCADPDCNCRENLVRGWGETEEAAIHAFVHAAGDQGALWQAPSRCLTRVEVGKVSERIYIVVLRTLDLPDRKLCMTSGRIASHAVHAAAKLQYALPAVDVQDKDIIILSVAGSKELEQLRIDLDSEQVSFLEYKDVDRVFEGERLTAIVTHPIEKNQSRALKVLRPWKCACNETTFPRSSVVEHSVLTEGSRASTEADSGSIPAGGASSKEQP